LRAPHWLMSCPTSRVTPGPNLMLDVSIVNAVSARMGSTSEKRSEFHAGPVPRRTARRAIMPDARIQLHDQGRRRKPTGRFDRSGGGILIGRVRADTLVPDAGWVPGAASSSSRGR